MGKNENDEHSDIYLYCLVNPEHEELFLSERITHLHSYRQVLF